MTTKRPDPDQQLRKLIAAQNARKRAIAERMIDQQVASGLFIRLPGGYVIERDKATPEQLAAALPGEAAAMTNALLSVLVVGVLALALGVDLAAVIGWLRRMIEP